MIDLRSAARVQRSNETLMRSSAMVQYLREMTVNHCPRTEQFHVVYLGADRAFLGDEPLGRAGADCLSFRMRELFTQALALDARALLVAHNHPSGDCRPSAVDIAATKRLKAAASILDIELLDHLIYSETALYSMRAGGKL